MNDCTRPTDGNPPAPITETQLKRCAVEESAWRNDGWDRRDAQDLHDGIAAWRAVHSGATSHDCESAA